MAIFELTARHFMDMKDGNCFYKGDSVRVDIFSKNIHANNLLINPESRKAVIEQMSNKGLDKNAVSNHIYGFEVKELRSGSPLEQASLMYRQRSDFYLNSPIR